MLAAMVYGCTPQDPATLPRAPNAGAAAGPKAKSSDPLGPRYAASLSDGIAFARAGAPVWLASAFGLSIPEPWGRWTDGDVVVLRLAMPLPRNVTIEIHAGAYADNIGRPVRVALGGQLRDVVFTGGPFEGATTVTASFPNELDSDTLVLLLPAARPATASDPRRLGLAMRTLRILNTP